jgi:hypothetical protein
MSLANELSSEIAVAVLKNKKTPQELRNLKEVLLLVHDELQRMSREARDERLRVIGEEPKSAD